MQKFGASIALAATIVLSACGGGGGTGGGINPTPPPPPPPSFTSFSAVQPNSTVTVDGTSLEGTMVVNSAGLLPPATFSTPTETTASIRYTTDAQRSVNSVTVTGRNSSVSFSTTNSITETFTDTAGRPIAIGTRNSTGSDQLLSVDPYVLGFNYQTFGIWGSGIVAGQTARYGAVSVGAATATSAVPASGSANFSGFIGGIYVDPNGEGFRYGANAAFAVNFGTRSIVMSTSGDRLVNVNTNIQYIWNVPLSATMTYAPGSSRFSGVVRAGNVMSGNGSGTFYGPAANELGGTFFISGAAGKMVGGFGAKQ